MCGIAGFFGPEDLTAAENVSVSIEHRGPDAASIIYDADVGLHLIHRRLAILDIEHGQQPMWNSDQSIGVIFNGEIYNHAELRQELIALGYSFKTDHSDTEVLVHGYSAWADGLAAKLNGMFAFAILDKRKKSLYLARDRFGEKPLYVYQSENQFAFASEIQAIQAMPNINLETDALSLTKYFSFGFFPGGASLFKHVEQLQAGHHVTLSLTRRIGDWRMRARPYWQFELSPSPDIYSGLSDQDVGEMFWEKFQRAVERRLISDVPIGLFLSGGLDSSAILAAFNASQKTRDVECFTIGFKEKSYDESHYARQAADYFGCTHHIKTFDQAAVLEGIQAWLPKFSEPLGDPSVLPTSLLCQFAKERVTVALSGDGGDELLAGYDPFLALKFAKFCQYFALPFTIDLAKMLLNLFPKSDKYMAMDFKIMRALEGIIEERPLWEPVWMSPVTPRHLKAAFSQEFAREDVFADVYTMYEKLKTATTLQQALSYFTQFYLINNILVKSDRASMLNSLESRAVFLDNDLVDFCARLPDHYKLRGRTRKFILKTALESRLPRDLIERKKQGFGIPFSQWLRDTNIADQPNAVPYLKDSFVELARTQHKSGQSDHRLFLYSWLAANQSSLTLV